MKKIFLILFILITVRYTSSQQGRIDFLNIKNEQTTNVFPDGLIPVLYSPYVPLDDCVLHFKVYRNGKVKYWVTSDVSNGDGGVFFRVDYKKGKWFVECYDNEDNLIATSKVLEVK